MKKLSTPILASLLATSAFALDIAEDITITGTNDPINFIAPNVTLTITGELYSSGYSPSVNFDKDYVYSAGDKVTLNLEEGATFEINDASGGLFGNFSNSSSKADIYITGKGSVNSTLNTIVTANNKSKLFLDASTSFVNATYKIGQSAATNLTLTNTLQTKVLVLERSSTLTMDADADSSAKIDISGYKFDILGTLVQKSGKINLKNGTAVVKGTLDLSVENGLQAKYFTAYTGSTIIIRAKNAIMKDDSVYSNIQIAASQSTTLKLYADQQFDGLDLQQGTLNAYTNGNELTFAKISSAGTLNIFIEDGYNWENNKIHFTNAVAESVLEILSTIQIGDTVVDESFWDIVSDGANGVYVNLTTVPEPAEWAMIFGVVAIAFVAYCRRK